MGSTSGLGIHKVIHHRKMARLDSDRGFETQPSRQLATLTKGLPLGGQRPKRGRAVFLL